MLDTDRELETRHPVLRETLDVAVEVARTNTPILITGESGTGKSTLVRVLHSRSQRAASPFLEFACSNRSSASWDSELFGHSPGAFAGALYEKVGAVEMAAGGTLFLDEIAEFPLPIQAKLTRLLQDQTYERFGESRSRTADVRIMAGTRHDLRDRVKQGQFREDLFYRLKVLEVELPPLRNRLEDLPRIASHLLEKLVRESRKPIIGFSDEAHAALLAYSWPGNIRELRNAIERGVILSREETIAAEHLPFQVVSGVTAGLEIGGSFTIAELEAEHIRRVVASTATLEEAARILGIVPSTLYRKRKRRPR